MSLNDIFGEFPGRPDHPDFAKLVDIVLQNDGRSYDADFDLPTHFGEIVDFASLQHMAQQRTMQMMDRNGMNPALNAKVMMMVVAAYFDAFLLGYRFHEKKSTEA